MIDPLTPQERAMVEKAWRRDRLTPPRKRAAPISPETLAALLADYDAGERNHRLLMVRHGLTYSQVRCNIVRHNGS